MSNSLNKSDMNGQMNQLEEHYLGKISFMKRCTSWTQRAGVHAAGTSPRRLAKGLQAEWRGAWKLGKFQRTSVKLSD